MRIVSQEGIPIRQPRRRRIGTLTGRWRLRAMGPLLMVVASAMLWAQASLAVETGDKFKDWTVHCEKPDDATPEQCVIFQTLVNNDTQKPVLQLTVGYLGPEKEPVALFQVPLGVALRPGVDVKVDSKDLVRIPFERCDPGGCMAGLALSSQLISALKGGSKGQVIVHDASGRQVPLEVSLSGFTAGFDALR